MLRFATHAVLGVLALLVVLEIIFRILPVSTATMTDYYFDPDLLTYPTDHCWRVATGWDLRNSQKICSNNFGFAADIDFVPDERAIALIGDSYVEASMLAPKDRPGAQLARLLPERKVYAMGMPGSALLDYAQRIRWATQQFQVRDFVLLLEQFDARQSLCGSGNVHSRCLDSRTFEPRIERQASASAIKRVLRYSALAQYIVGQIRFKPESLIDAMFTRVTPESAARLPTTLSVAPSEEDIFLVRLRTDAVVEEFFAVIRPHLQGKLIVLVDGQRSGLQAELSLSDIERSHMIRLLRKGGAEVVDLVPVYQHHTQRSERSLAVGPYDGHLNNLGVTLVMTRTYKLLFP